MNATMPIDAADSANVKDGVTHINDGVAENGNVAAPKKANAAAPVDTDTAESADAKEGVISIDDGVKNEAAASKKNNAAVPMDTAHSADAKERAISIASTPEAVTMRTRMP